MLTPEQIAHEEATAEAYERWHNARQGFFHPAVAQPLYSREEAAQLAGINGLPDGATGTNPEGVFTRADIVRLWFSDAPDLNPSDVVNGIVTNRGDYLPDEVTVPRAFLRHLLNEINGEV
jgi:hypothetical protein